MKGNYSGNSHQSSRKVLKILTLSDCLTEQRHTMSAGPIHANRASSQLHAPLKISSWGAPWWSMVGTLHFHCRETPALGTKILHSCLENPRDGGAWWAPVYGTSVLSHRVAHDRSDLAAVAAAVYTQPYTMCFTHVYSSKILHLSLYRRNIRKQPAQGHIFLKSVVLFEPRDAKSYVYHIEPISFSSNHRLF